MKKLFSIIAVLFFANTLSGCAFLSGAGAGVAGGVAGYEISAKRQLDQLEKDYQDKKLSKEEYDIRVNQVKKGTLLNR